jgi:hypothetical protein
MKIPIVWIGILLILGVVVVFSVKGFQLYEDFQNEQTYLEGFATSVKNTTITPKGTQTVETTQDPLQRDIVLTACPAETNFYIDTGGRGACCDSRVLKGACSGKVVCSLSEGSKGLPTCSEYYSEILDAKGKQRCPLSMPNYYESDSVKGCTSGLRNKDGTGPADLANSSFCVLYTSEVDENQRLDSCTNVMMFENTRCFSRDIPNTKKTIEAVDGLPALISCSYMDSSDIYLGNVPRKCFSDESLERHINAKITLGSMDKNILEAPKDDRWCSVAQNLHIDKVFQRSAPVSASAPSLDVASGVSFGSEDVSSGTTGSTLPLVPSMIPLEPDMGGASFSAADSKSMTSFADAFTTLMAGMKK